MGPNCTAPGCRRRTTTRRTPAAAALVTLLLLAGTAACGRGEEPAGGTATGAPTEGAALVEPTTTIPATTTTVDPGTLPQTEAKPAVDSADFDARVQALWKGIVDDDPAEAMPFFFPLTAYRQVKPIKDPDGDWKNRLVGTYEQEIHALHKQLGKDPSAAVFEGIDVPMGNAQWMKPGTENNKLPYWRVLSSKVRYSVGGQKKSFVVSSMISWRGEWYVVHLTAPPR
ncbi:MAG: hypothetical protein U0Q07_13450 [Acidimicrobiales bacterium]